MLLNVHSYYSLRYGTIGIEPLVDMLLQAGYDSAVLTDINNTSGSLEFIKCCNGKGFRGNVGVEFRDGDTLLYIGIAINDKGFQELNELLTSCSLMAGKLTNIAPRFNNVYVIYPFGYPHHLRENEFIGVKPKHLNKLRAGNIALDKYVIWHPVTFANKKDFRLHCQLRAINNNILLSQLQQHQVGDRDELLIAKNALLDAYKEFPGIISNTNKLIESCNFQFDFGTVKNKATFTGSRYDDKVLLNKLAHDGLKWRYGVNNKEATLRVKKELEIIDNLGFSSYFLITHDIIRYSMSKGYYHVGRGSGANSVVAYCLKITDVCPIELDLYFERFLNPKRKSPPDFDIDFSWDERDDVYDYIFKRYGHRNTALLGAMSTFKDKSIIRELGKVYGLPKSDIDRIIDEPNAILNKHEITDLILSVYGQLEDFPNLRTIHPCGVLISELPITNYSALDLPPKGLPTVQWDMYTAEDIGFEKFDILSQRGIGHIKESAEIIKANRGIKVDVHAVDSFKKDKKVQQQLKSGDTIGCFYVESPAMRGLLKKLKCEDYITLVAASSIIRPGVAKSGMMKAYIERFHDPAKVQYLHPVMEEQLKETFGVMVYQEDVLKVGHHFGGLDLADADVLRRMMSGKGRNKKHLQEIEQKYFDNCKRFGYPDAVAKEVWRQMESFAGYSFSKAHSASFAVESFQSLYLKTYYPIEFMTAVINNFGGFYSTRVYVNEARKAGASIHLPCVNNSNHYTRLTGTDLYLGFIHIKDLESAVAQLIPDERKQNGPYTGLENFALRTQVSLEQAIILIRIGALRFTGKNKKSLLWEAHVLLNKSAPENPKLFNSPAKAFTLPVFETAVIEDAYDELELLGFPVTIGMFDLLQTDYRGEIQAKGLIQHVGKYVRMVGNYITAKHVRTVRNETMNFGTFLDANGDFFDTTHFPPSLRAYPFKGAGVYLIRGKVVEEFGFPSIEVEKMAKLPIKPDPRGR
jgi:DNA-directed DNA polymerase III PolC